MLVLIRSTKLWGPILVNLIVFKALSRRLANILRRTKSNWGAVLSSMKDETWNNSFVYNNMKLLIIKICLGDITTFLTVIVIFNLTIVERLCI